MQPPGPSRSDTEPSPPSQHRPSGSMTGSASPQQPWKSAETAHTSEPDASKKPPRTPGCCGSHPKASTHASSSTNSTDTKCGSTPNSTTTTSSNTGNGRRQP